MGPGCSIAEAATSRCIVSLTRARAGAPPVSDDVQQPQNSPLLYFDRIVLARYRSRPDLYRVSEDDMGGAVDTVCMAEADGGVEIPRVCVRFGFRQLSDGRVCVAAFRPDLDSIAGSERAAWDADMIEAPAFAGQDAAFERWSQRYLHGSWESREGPAATLTRELRLIQALTRCGVGGPLFRTAYNPALGYPVAENSVALTFARLELARLVVDEIEIDALRKLAMRLSVTLAPEMKTLSSLKELLPEALHGRIRHPLRVCWEHRNRIHRVPPATASRRPAFRTFDHELRAACAAIAELRGWLEKTLSMNAERCLQREEAMTFFEKLDGPLRPECKHDELRLAEGKTIARVEAGERRPGTGCHAREVLVLHFTDGTALAIDIGSNAATLATDIAGLDAEMFETDLMLTWAPSTRE